MNTLRTLRIVFLALMLSPLHTDGSHVVSASAWSRSFIFVWAEHVRPCYAVLDLLKLTLESHKQAVPGSVAYPRCKQMHQTRRKENEEMEALTTTSSMDVLSLLVGEHELAKAREPLALLGQLQPSANCKHQSKLTLIPAGFESGWAPRLAETIFALRPGVLSNMLLT